LNERTLALHGARVSVPTYERRALRPGVVHIGVGAFHRSHQDGNVRIDYTQEAMAAYLQYLATVDPLEGGQ